MKVLIKGCEALGEATIRSGCHAFFGYPITPQTEIVAYLSKKMPQYDRLILQAESEIAAINMVYGAAASGFRVITSTSSPGMSLKAEGISYIAGSDLPCVLVNVCRVGPGLGGIQPSQQDYFVATRALGHGGFRVIVLAPNSVQEIYDLTKEAFELADTYRNPVMIFLDGMLGQIMEPIELEENYINKVDSLEEIRVKKPWACNGKRGRENSNSIHSLYLNNNELYDQLEKTREKYIKIKENVIKFESIFEDDMVDIILVSFGIVSRVCEKVKEILLGEGIKVGIIRPITLWPFPYDEIKKYSDRTKYGFLCVEINLGQMVEDVILGLNNNSKVYSLAKVNGSIIDSEEIQENIKLIIRGEKHEYKI